MKTGYFLKLPVFYVISSTYSAENLLGICWTWDCWILDCWIWGCWTIDLLNTSFLIYSKLSFIINAL